MNFRELGPVGGVPVILLHALGSGAPTSHVPLEALTRMSQAIPNCHLITIPNAGHRIHTAKPHDFWSAVAPFLS